MDGVVYIDQRAIFGISFAMRRHHHPRPLKLEELSFPARCEAGLQCLDSAVDDKSRASKKPVERKMRIGGNSPC